MKLAQTLTDDLYLMSVIDQISVPAMLVGSDQTVLHANAAAGLFVPVENLGDSYGSILQLLTKSVRESAISELDAPKITGRVTFGFPMRQDNLSMYFMRTDAENITSSRFISLIAQSGPENLEYIADLELRWRHAIEGNGQGLWDINSETGLQYFSQAWFHLYRIDPQIQPDTILDVWLEKVHPDDRDLFDTIEGKSSYRDHEKFSFEFRVRQDDGGYIWILTRGRVLSRDAAGKPQRMIGTDTDISAIKTHAMQLGNVSKSLELAVTTAGIGIWEHNLETHETKWDRQMCVIYGIDPDKPRPPGDLWEMHLHPDDRDETIIASHECLKTGEDFFRDYRVLRADGIVKHVRSRASLHVDGAGKRTLIGVNWDITSDRETAAGLTRANALALQQNQALETARANMEYMALHDALTGLANRRMLDDAHRAALANKNGLVPAVLHVDLDRFKQINDTIGHDAGDKVLIHAADILSAAAPKDALVSRVGGDEFVIFLEDAPNDDVLADLAKKIIQAAQKPFQIDGVECRFGMSIGIATGRIVDDRENALFANADLAMYLAKKDGRGRFHFYSEDLKIAAEAKRRNTDEILGAFERSEFFCMYQPQFDAKTLKISGVEGLVRWKHPDGTIRTPAQFLAEAEDLDVVAQIDQIVLDCAVNDMATWAAAGLKVPRMSVNVSARRLGDPDLGDKLRKTAVQPGQIAFELLESVFLDTYDTQLADNLQLMRDMGIEIEIDDFGTGHASIIGLLKLQPARLKIDGELISPVVMSEKQRHLVKSIVEIGKMQGIVVVAEGVETKAHIAVLQHLGCDFLQGYGLARPMSADALATRLDPA